MEVVVEGLRSGFAPPRWDLGQNIFDGSFFNQ